MFSRFTLILRILFVAVLFVIIKGCKEDDKKVVFELPSGVIYKIVCDKNGTKWIATDKGVVCYDGLEWNPYPDIPFENSFPVSDLNISSFTDNEIWIGGTQGASYLKFSASEILSSGNYSAQKNGLISDTISSLAVDPLNNKYFGTSLGLSIYNNDNWTVFYGRDLEPILQEYPIRAIATAKNGWIYAATYGGGVSRFKFADAVSAATTYNSDWSGLRSDYVNTVIIVDDTCQWYGTNSGAAYHTSHLTKTLTDWNRVTSADGLISDTVLSIAKDLNGNVWFGTSNGVSCLKNREIVNYTSTDGLVSNKVNTISVDIDGSIWFGTDHGLSHFINNTWKSYIPE